MEYWKDGSWLVGCLPQVPGVFSQGKTLDELETLIGRLDGSWTGRGLRPWEPFKNL